MKGEMFMRNIRQVVLLTLFLAFGVLMIGSESQAATASINKKKLTMYVGEIAKLKVKNTKKKVKWSSSKKSVVTVSKKGVVTAKKKGKAVITAKVGKKKLKCKVTVEKDNMRISERYLDLEIGEKRGLVVLGTTRDAKWSSSNKKVATVSKDGVVKAKSEGTATITAKVGSKKMTMNVYVYKKISTKNQYSYKMYRLTDSEHLYTGCSYIYYIKSDNPEGGPAFTLNMYDQYGRKVNFGMQEIKNFNFPDVDKMWGFNSGTNRVDGGFITVLYIDDVGEITVKLAELRHTEGESSWGELEEETIGVFTVEDYDKAENEFIDSLITDYTDDTMNVDEKLTAITTELRSRATYLRNYINEDGDIAIFYLTSEFGRAWWEDYRWDSCASPYYITRIAARMNYSVRSMYGDYPYGSPEWIEYHHRATGVYNGETKYYSMCPFTHTGRVDDLSQIPKVDFSAYK